MKKAFRIVFVIVMLLCTGVLIWHVPASTLLDQQIVEARSDLEHEQKLLEKQVKEDHVIRLDRIRSYQDELDALFSPELDEYRRLDQTKDALVKEKGELQKSIKTKKAEKKALEKLLNNPEPEAQESEGE